MADYCKEEENLKENDPNNPDLTEEKSDGSHSDYESDEDESVIIESDVEKEATDN